MQIQELRLKAFGPFTNCAVSLCPGLNILYGPNEAGKSSALRAIRSLLYGIETQTADNFLHPYNQLRLGAVLARQDGQTVEFCRRKGRKNTLRDGADDKPLDDGVLDAYLGAVDEEFFLSVFGIDHDRLRRGGEEVVRGGGQIGELLFSAGGVGDLRLRQQQIEAELSDLYKPGGQRPKINRNLSELHRLRGEVKRLQASADVWTHHQEELHRIQRRRDDVDQDLRDKKTARSRLNRIHAALPSLARWKSESNELSAIKDAPVLAESFAEELHKTLSRLNLSEGREADAKRDVAKLKDELARETVSHEILAEEESIQSIFLRLGSHRKGMQDRGGLVTSRQRAQHSAREILRKLGRSESLDDIEKHRIPDDKDAQIQALANRFEAISQRHRSATKQRDRFQRRLRDEESRFHERQLPVDASDLRTTLKESQPDRGIEDELAERQMLIDQSTSEIELALQRLALWTGTFVDLEKVVVPPLETIDHFDEEFRDSRNHQSALEQRAREAQAEIEQLEQDQSELERGNEVPTEDELVQRRQDRDGGWSLVLADWKQLPFEVEDVRQFVEQLSPANDLADAFVVSIERADTVADRLRREADRVATKAQLDSRRNTVEKRLEEVQRQRELLEHRQAEQQSNWEARWSASGIIPLTPREMRAWLDDCKGILELGKNLKGERRTLERLQIRRDRLREMLFGAMSAVAVPVDADVAKFVELVDSAQRCLDELEVNSTGYEQQAKDIERLRQDLADAEEEFQGAADDLAAWKSEWAEAMKYLHLPEDAVTTQASSVLTNLSQLFQEHREAEGIRLRIVGIDEDAHALTEDVVALAKRLASDIVARPVEEMVTELHSRAIDAREAQHRVDALNEQLNQQQKKLSAAETAISEAKAELAAMCVQAACARIDELAEAEARSTRKRGLQDSLATLEDQLRSLSGGQSIELFAEEASLEDVDELVPRIEELDQEIQTLAAERDNLLQVEQREKDDLGKIDGSADAAQKACECEFLVTELEEQLHDYAVLRIASAVLRRAVERYREKAQGPIVTRASEVFHVLTRGSFAGLRADFDEDGQPVLLGVRPDEQTTLRVGAMSEGACDQLYLALRIATVEHWFEHHEPVPFIIDDVLLSFDDQRAEAALVALAELSKKTQIVFFTHHDHLVSIAKTAMRHVLDESEFMLNTEWLRSS